MTLIGSIVTAIYGIGAALGLLCLYRLIARRRRRPQEALPLRTACVYLFLLSTTVALAAELTVFNYQHYLCFQADEPIVYKTDATPQNSAEDSVTITLPDINRKVTSLYIDSPLPARAFRITYQDDESTRIIDKTIYNFSEYSKYIPLIPHGRVYRISVTGTGPFPIAAVALNAVIPIDILALRLVLCSLVVFGVFLLLHKEARAKIAWLLFIYHPDNAKIWRRATLILWLLVGLFCVFTCLDAFTLYNSPEYEPYKFDRKIYDYLTDALLKGQLHLDIAAPDWLLASSRPYDQIARQHSELDYPWDFAYYQGRYYCYFGIVPALLLNLPFKLLTGACLPNHVAVAIFSVLACLFLALLWREIVRRFLPHMPLCFYGLGALTIMLGSGIGLLCRRPLVYEVTIASALMFVVLGTWLLCRAFSATGLALGQLGLGALALALAVGCRPTAVLGSLLLPVFLVYAWRQKWPGLTGTKNIIRLALYVTIPYIVVALPLMWYNYARFASVTDFGAFYQLTVANMSAVAQASPLGKLVKLLAGYWAYFFCPLTYSAHFPFVTLNLDSKGFGGYWYDTALPVYLYTTNTMGLINLPILWLLGKSRLLFTKGSDLCALPRQLMMVMLIIGLLNIGITTLTAGIHSRYTVDFVWLFIFPALVCAYRFYAVHKDNKEFGRMILKIVYTLCSVTILIELFISLTGEKHFITPQVEYYLSRVFGMC